MDVSLHHNDRVIHPWRTAALVAGSVAAVELIVLVVVGGALLAKPATSSGVHPVKKTHAAATSHRTPVAKTHAKAPAIAELSRRKVSVLVLNGNGRQGAAASTAARVSKRGYRLRGVANAPSADFTRSLVKNRRGFEGEGQRLARDLGIRIVGPLDGMRASQLHGAHAVVVVGT